jgi:homoserine kinase type II
VLSHFDVGRIQAIREFRRGSRKSPKLLIQTDTGTYMLKRRAQGKDDPFRVAFSHALQLYLAAKQFPLPRLIGTREDNRSMLQYQHRVYEMFEYIKGGGYDNSLDATGSAGRTLALFHKLLADYQPEYEPPVGSYHASRAVARSMETIPHALAKIDPRTAASAADRIAAVVAYLRTTYNEAAMRVNEMGLPDWPMQITHADWHPGNMLFRGSRVVAVIDYDAARIQQRIIDVANAVLQFSILGGGDDPAQWPNAIDIARFRRFIAAYDSVPDCVITRAELKTIPWLMLEALICESVIPIAATGSFARLDGLGFLLMIERKARWLQGHVQELTAAIDEG